MSSSHSPDAVTSTSCLPFVPQLPLNPQKGAFFHLCLHLNSFSKTQLIPSSIYNSYQLATPTRPLIIYLPPTGSHLRQIHPPIPSILHSHPLATINYRWNHIPSSSKPSSSPFTTIPTSHPFPTPLHDTLHAYTWLTSQYLPSLNLISSANDTTTKSDALQTPPPSPPTRSKSTPRSIIVYGTHLGGTLAASLALTECKDSRNVPYNIAGLIVKDGVFDWTHVATTLATGPSPSSPVQAYSHEELELTTPWTLQTLQSLTHTLFATPASTFDAFASPLLFFRTPGLAVPTTPYFPGHSPPPSPLSQVDISGLSLSDAEYAALSSAEFDILPSPSSPHPPSNSSTSTSYDARKSALEPEAPKIANLKFPPRDSGLKIPRSLFLSTTPKVPAEGGDGEVREQASEMARLMRRSVVLHEFKERVLWDEDLDPHQAAAERVQTAEVRNGNDREEESVVGEWMEGGDY